MKHDIHHITVCPGTLKTGFNGYSPAVWRHLYDNKKVPHILDLPPPDPMDYQEVYLENRERLSLSGVQEKMSLILEKSKLRLTRSGEQGQYILKPIPREVKKTFDVPANEHLTMQLASQVYGIHTAQNALVFFEDGNAAYITRRFDVRKDATKRRVEDFATLRGKSSATDGRDFKYTGSYIDMKEVIDQFVDSAMVELDKFFKVVLFNYLFSNGDAHLKNFSLMETEDGDFVFSPFYDLINTRVHVADTAFALKGGLFDETYRSNDYRNSGYPIGREFMTFGEMLGLPQKRVGKVLKEFLGNQDKVIEMIERSYLSPGSKRGYKSHYGQRRNLLIKGI